MQAARKPRAIQLRLQLIPWSTISSPRLPRGQGARQIRREMPAPDLYVHFAFKGSFKSFQFRTLMRRGAMALAVTPSSGNNVAQIGVRGNPTELVDECCRIGTENGRVAQAAVADVNRYIESGDFLDRRADLTDRVRGSGPDVIGRESRLVHLVEGKNVSVGNVQHMDVVANTGSVGRGIVFAVDREMFAGSGRRIEEQGDNVRFGAMILAEIIRRSGGVEV